MTGHQPITTAQGKALLIPLTCWQPQPVAHLAKKLSTGYVLYTEKTEYTALFNHLSCMYQPLHPLHPKEETMKALHLAPPQVLLIEAAVGRAPPAFCMNHL